MEKWDLLKVILSGHHIYVESTDPREVRILVDLLRDLIKKRIDASVSPQGHRAEIYLYGDATDSITERGKGRPYMRDVYNKLLVNVRDRDWIPHHANEIFVRYRS
jgi:hypothetical protein